MIPAEDGSCPNIPGYDYKSFYTGPNDRDFITDFSTGFLLPFQVAGGIAQALAPAAGPMMGAAAFGK